MQNNIASNDKILPSSLMVSIVEPIPKNDHLKIVTESHVVTGFNDKSMRIYSYNI